MTLQDLRNRPYQVLALSLLAVLLTGILLTAVVVVAVTPIPFSPTVVAALALFAVFCVSSFAALLHVEMTVAGRRVDHLTLDGLAILCVSGIFRLVGASQLRVGVSLVGVISVLGGVFLAAVGAGTLLRLPVVKHAR